MADITLRRSLPLRRAQKLNLFFFYLGLILLVLFMIQSIFNLKVPFLVEWQSNGSYKKWSGFVLAFYIGLQWVLPILRMTKRQKLVKRFYPIHKYAGAFAPLIYYFHSMEWGYAYLIVLSTVYFANIVLGLFSLDIVGSQIKNYRKQYSFIWMVLHVSLSLLTVWLMVYHIYIAYAYQ